MPYLWVLVTHPYNWFYNSHNSTLQAKHICLIERKYVYASRQSHIFVLLYGKIKLDRKTFIFVFFFLFFRVGIVNGLQLIEFIFMKGWIRSTKFRSNKDVWKHLNSSRKFPKTNIILHNKLWLCLIFSNLHFNLNILI